MSSGYAEKRCAEIVDVNPSDEQLAKGMNLPFDVVAKMVDISVPLRRPNKRSPSMDYTIEKLTPSNDVLQRIAESHPAPPEWYDEDE